VGAARCDDACENFAHFFRRVAVKPRVAKPQESAGYATYGRIRRQHLVLSLRALSRRQQTTLVLAAAILGPGTLAFVAGLASGFETFVSPRTALGWRALAWAAWLATTGLIVLALREAVFMLAARPFLRMLPISRARHFACDVRSIAIAYSFLWLPVGYFLWERWSSQRGWLEKIDATFVLAAGLAIGIALQALAMQRAARALRLAAPAAIVVPFAPTAPWPVSWTLLVVALAVAGLAVASGYERPSRSRRAKGPALPFASRAAAWSGLAIPVAWRDLRHALGLRVGLVVAVLGAGAYLAADGAFCGRRTGMLLVASAAFTLAFYRAPLLVDERLRASLPWLFRLREARARAIAFAGATGFIALCASIALAAALWRAGCGPLPSLTVATPFGVLAIVLALTAFRWRDASSWIAVLAVLALASALGDAL
jgi:hypothetical protein